MMRDLLYLSENNMRALVPQLPGQLRRRLGFEAGLTDPDLRAVGWVQFEEEFLYGDAANAGEARLT